MAQTPQAGMGDSTWLTTPGFWFSCEILLLKLIEINHCHI